MNWFKKEDPKEAMKNLKRETKREVRVRSLSVFGCAYIYIFIYAVAEDHHSSWLLLSLSIDRHVIPYNGFILTPLLVVFTLSFSLLLSRNLTALSSDGMYRIHISLSLSILDTILTYCLDPYSQSNQRDLEREIRDLDRQEKQTTVELKARAKVAGSMNDPAVKALAKQLVQVRQQRGKLQGAKAQLGAMGMHATVTASQMAAASAIGSVTGSMQAANKHMNIQKMTGIMADFQRENERAAVKEEMMDDILTDAFDNDEIEEEADQVTAQVLAELGVEFDSQMVGLSVPSSKPVGEELTAAEQDALNDVLPDLKARLDAL
jgi:division protein CdvB (Snf7/Vps24/ESCRT-III family)